MRLTALVESPDHVCCRYRLKAFAPYLERAGDALELLPFPDGWWSRLRLAHRLRGASLVVQRRLLPGWQLALLRRAVRHLVFDCDDAVFLRDSYSPRGLHSPRRLRRFAAMVRTADVVVAGNSYLCEQAERHGASGRTRLVPTCVDPRLYPVAKHARAGGVDLVWIGSSSTLRGLEEVSPLFEELGRRVPGVRLKLVCDRSFPLHGMPVYLSPWSERGEGAALAAADVGVSWLPDDLWSRGKCGLKVLQYMAAGLPVVANPVGVQAELVRHGETGYLATTADEWAEAVARLASDPPLRRRMGEAGRRRVVAEYSVAVGARRWLALLDELHRERKRTAG